MRRALALAALLGPSLLAGDPPHGVTEVFNAKCDDVARVAVPLFQKRGWIRKNVSPPWPHCTRTTLCFDDGPWLDSNGGIDLACDKLRTFDRRS